MIMRTLLLIKDITVYNPDGLFARRFSAGTTVHGKYEPLLSGYNCTEEGLTFIVFHDECVPC